MIILGFWRMSSEQIKRHGDCKVHKQALTAAPLRPQQERSRIFSLTLRQVRRSQIFPSPVATGEGCHHSGGEGHAATAVSTATK